MDTFNRTIWTLAVALGLVIASQSGAQNAVVGWHAVMESTVAGSGRKNAVALPYHAYVDVAMYDAVTAIDRRFQPFAVRVDAPDGASEDAAAASAAHDVLVHYFPSQATTLDAALASSLPALLTARVRRTGSTSARRLPRNGWRCVPGTVWRRPSPTLRVTARGYGSRCPRIRPRLPTRRRHRSGCG
jgi:hypothetical protein